MTYTVLIEVKCTAPVGYKPRTSTYKGFGLTDDKREVEQLKELAINEVRESLSEQNPGIEIQYKASATIHKNNFYVTTNINNHESKN